MPDLAGYMDCAVKVISGGAGPPSVSGLVAAALPTLKQFSYLDTHACIFTPNTSRYARHYSRSSGMRSVKLKVLMVRLMQEPLNCTS